jgi:NifB/MoaA-like Fe-S oxidoreductase
MTEEVSSVYENVSIESWADSIYKIKVEELRKIVEQKQKEFDAYVAICTPANHNTLQTAFNGLDAGLDLIVLKFKYAGLLKHGRK